MALVAFLLALAPNLPHAGGVAEGEVSPPRVRSPQDGGKTTSQAGLLVRDLGTIAKPGTPGVVTALSQTAVPILLGENGLPVVVTGTLGKGRVVAFGHGGFFNEEALVQGDTRVFIRRAVEWAASKPSAKVVVLKGTSHAEAVRSFGMTPIEAEPKDLATALAQADAAILMNQPDEAVIRPFVRNGGGLLVAQTPWGWLQLNPGKALDVDFPWNRVLREAGIAFADGYVGRVMPVKMPEDADASHSGQALARVREGRAGKNDGTLVTAALRALPKQDPFWGEARALASEVGLVVPSDADPVRASDGRRRIALVIQEMDGKFGKLDFPGGLENSSGSGKGAAASPSAAKIARLVSIPGGASRWVGTGSYAAPGAEIVVRVPEGLRGKGLQVQIGAHSDTIWHLDEWKRHPNVLRRAPLNSDVVRLKSPFGGLIYFVTPPNAPTGIVRVEGGVAAPRYVLGETTQEGWKAQLQSPAPWSEIEGRHLVLTVPTEAARKVLDPAALMELWDRTLEGFSELDGEPLPERPERIVADRQISAGYMHAGYPIMTWMDDSVPLSLDVARLTSQGSWGHWHELGHNRQIPMWTSEGMGEVTNNLYTLFAMTTVAKKGLWERLESTKPAVKRHFESGAPFDRWKSEPFVALTTYAELVDAFGWDACKRWFRSYRNPDFGPLPRNDAEKRDQWMVRYSKVTGRNLAPFFDRWGIPVSEAARAAVRDLPAWDGIAR